MNKVPFLATLIFSLFLLSCGDSSTNINGGSVEDPDDNSGTPQQPDTPVAKKPNRMVVELTYYKELTALDAFGGAGDPKITVNVKSYIGDAVVKNSTTRVLLNKDDIRSWSGSEQDIVDIYPTADKIEVRVIIVDKDVTFDDDVSPSEYLIIKSFSVGNTVNKTFTGSKTQCTLNLRFIE